MATSNITQEQLRSLLHYDPATGVFTWLHNKRGPVKAGTVAGSLAHGYVTIKIRPQRIFAHRLAWLYVYGELPAAYIDHINGMRDDNRIDNLRLATVSENGQNRTRAQRNSSSGVLGVSPYRDKTFPWLATICIAGKDCKLGTFKTKEDARAAYLYAKRRLHPFSITP